VSPPAAPQGPPALISFVPGGGRSEGSPSNSPAPSQSAATPTPKSTPPAANDDFELDESTVAKVAPMASQSATTRPQVQAVACPAGHPDAPHAERCRTCGADIVDRSIRLVPRPAVGFLRFEDGRTVDVDRPLLVGRKPTVDAIGDADELPGLVTLPDTDGMLSRVHAEIRVEGWEVLVVDRGSTNGTRVEIPGQPPTVLRPGEPCVITSGTTVSFADVATARFDTGPR
jgi:FHA domain